MPGRVGALVLTGQSIQNTPTWKGEIMNEVIRARYAAADTLAARGDGDVEKAYSLIRRIARYAIADANQWERDNTEGQSVDAERRLNARRARLDYELSTDYGARLVNYGLYPSIVECGNEGREVCTIAYYD